MGKLAKWLRMMGYDTIFFNGSNDSHMVTKALAEDRVILPRDTQIMKRRVVTDGRVKAILVAMGEMVPRAKDGGKRTKATTRHTSATQGRGTSARLAARLLAGRTPTLRQAQKSIITPHRLLGEPPSAILPPVAFPTAMPARRIPMTVVHVSRDDPT